MTIPLRGSITAVPYEGVKLLKRALTMVHFSPIFKITDPSGAGVADFQDRIRSAYPQAEYELEQVVQLKIEDGQFRPTQQELPIWRFFDQDKSWRVSLTRESIAVETFAGYRGRADFIGRMTWLLAMIDDVFKPAQVKRAGARYVNLAVGDVAQTATKFCAPELVSITGTSELISADLLWRFPVDEGELQMRSGVLQPGASYDPAILDSVPERSWYLDIDVFNEENTSFEKDAIARIISEKVERALAIYRWAVPGQKDN